MKDYKTNNRIQRIRSVKFTHRKKVKIIFRKSLKSNTMLRTVSGQIGERNPPTLTMTPKCMSET